MKKYKCTEDFTSFVHGLDEYEVESQDDFKFYFRKGEVYHLFGLCHEGDKGFVLLSSQQVEEYFIEV